MAKHEDMSTHDCVKSVYIRSFFWSVFSHIRTEDGENTPSLVPIRKNTDQKKLRIGTIFKQCMYNMSKHEDYCLAG